MKFLNNTKMVNLIAFFSTILFVSMCVYYPRYIFETIYQTFIGRILLVCFIVLATSVNIILGLVIIIGCMQIINNFSSSNNIEGLENISTEQNGKEIKPIDPSYPNYPNYEIGYIGVDRENIKDSIRSKPSSEIPFAKHMFRSSDNVIANEPAHIEQFASVASV